MSESTERRRHARVRAPVRVELLVDGRAPVQASLSSEEGSGDLSEGGVFVAVASALPLGSRLQVRLSCDDGVQARIPARVVRVRWGGRRAGAPVGPGVALAFEEIDPAARALLQRFVRGDTPPGQNAS